MARCVSSLQRVSTGCQPSPDERAASERTREETASGGGKDAQPRIEADTAVEVRSAVCGTVVVLLVVCSSHRCSLAPDPV
jgi:hypothetical protein